MIWLLSLLGRGALLQKSIRALQVNFCVQNNQLTFLIKESFEDEVLVVVLVDERLDEQDGEVFRLKKFKGYQLEFQMWCHDAQSNDIRRKNPRNNKTLSILSSYAIDI
jgi:hypothetical protein